MSDENRRRASGIIKLQDGALIGGDSFLYYAGTLDAMRCNSLGLRPRKAGLQLGVFRSDIDAL